MSDEKERVREKGDDEADRQLLLTEHDCTNT